MNIEPLKNYEKARTLFNGVIAADNLVYKPLDEELFYDKFIKENETVKKINLEAGYDGETVGFGNASFRTGAETCYITFIAVDTKRRREGIGTALLSGLEAECKRLNPNVKKLDILFFNPIALEWVVPGTNGHDHPNAPGIDADSAAYEFFKTAGYKTFAIQNSFYRLLKDFRLSEDIEGKLESLREKGISVCYYDKEKHGSFDELCSDLGSDDWRNAITNNYSKEKPDPMMIVAKDSRVGGFAGPLRLQASGRGFFAGIGVHSEFRGGGAGKSLFSALCLGLKEMGAEYMTLFTGETNPARNIYLSAGFEIVKTWADMRKEVNNG